MLTISQLRCSRVRVTNIVSSVRKPKDLGLLPLVLLPFKIAELMCYEMLCVEERGDDALVVAVKRPLE